MTDMAKPNRAVRLWVLVDLLSKYGQEKRLNSFYAKYFKAFPQLLDSVKPNMIHWKDIQPIVIQFGLLIDFGLFRLDKY